MGYILSIFFGYFFFRILYYGLIELKKENVIWKVFWILTAIVQLLLALHFSGFIDLKYLIDSYKILAYGYAACAWLSFLVGGFIVATMCEDKDKQEKMYIGLFMTFVSSLLYIYMIW